MDIHFIHVKSRHSNAMPMIRQSLRARNDPREVVLDPHARYFGAERGERALIPAGDARLGETSFQEWLGQPMLQQR